MRTAYWVLVTLYLAIAFVALWGGWLELNPPVPPPTGANPDPLPLLVNAEMAVVAGFYLLTALAFGAVAALALRDGLLRRSGALVMGLNRAFAAFLAVVGAYLVWFGGQLLMLHGSPYYLAAGGALLTVAALVALRNRWSAWVYAATLAATLIWSASEAGLEVLPLLPRLAAWVVVGLWFLSPWHRAALTRSADERPDAGGRWVGLAQLASLAVLLVAALQPATFAAGARHPTTSAARVTDWRHYGNSAGGDRYVQLDQINVGNVARLKEAWRYRTGVPYDNKNTPLMVGGLLYHCAADNTLIAIDATTGREVWRHDTETRPGGGDSLETAPFFSGRVCRGVAYHEAPAGRAGQCPKRILVGTTDARLMAVDALTGRRCTDFGADGAVDLRIGMGPHAPGQYHVTSPPLIAGDIAVVGGWVADVQLLGLPSGVVRAYDAMTGDFVWAWDLGNPSRQGMPEPGDEYTRGTPNVWSIMSYDPQLNLIFAPTGNSSPDYFDGDLRSELAEKYASAVVALDAATGRPRWVYQTVHRDIWDYDVPAQPVLVNVRRYGRGEPIPALAQPTKRGEIFLLDRRTGAPIYDSPERPVPQGPEPGERVAATQPFSALPHFRDDPEEADMWGLTPLDQLHCRIEYRKMRYDGHLTPPMRGGGGYGQARATWGGALQFPGFTGGFNWGSVSVDADNGLLVAAPLVTANRVVLKSLADREAEAARTAARRKAWEAARGPRGTPGAVKPPSADASSRRIANGDRFDQNRILYRGESAPFLSAWRLPLPFLRRDGLGLTTELPCLEPPYGMLAVIDLNQNRLVWKRPFGSMKDTGPFGVKSKLPFTVGVPLMAGSITTRGGLIFHGGAMDHTLRAVDLRTGATKWEGDLPTSAHATPISYLGKDGKQYVVITAPNPSWTFPRRYGAQAFETIDDKGGYIIAYALPD